MKIKFCIFLMFMLVISNVACVFADECQAMPIILMYHRVSNEAESDAFTISPEQFESDIKYLKEQGYSFYMADEIKGIEKSNDKSVVITFDDGYESDFEIVLPILKKYDACATFFVIGSKVGQEGYMTKEQIKKLSDSGFAQIGNHSYALHELRYEEVLRKCFTQANEILMDISHNQKVLEEITGKKINTYSYPYGVYGNYIEYELKKCGMTTFCSEEKIKTMEPYGRMNRSFDILLEQIINKARMSPSIYHGYIR